MKLTPLERSLELRADAYNPEKRTVRLSVSSEAPVERWFGTEILDHDAGSVRLQRFNNAANVLFNHRMDDVIGVIEKAWVEDKRLMAEIRIAKSTRGDEIAGLIEDGILRNVSVGYRIHEIVEKTKSQEYRATDWEPYELSIVTVPADPSVGIGRSAGGEEVEVTVRSEEVLPPKGTPERSTTMTDPVKQDAPAGAAADVQVIDNETGTKLERSRVSALVRLGEQYKIEAATIRKWIDGDMSVSGAGDEVVRIMEARSKQEAQSPAALGMSKREVQGYSFMRAVRAVADKNWNGAGLELEAHQQIAKRLNTTPDPNKFYVPLDVQERAVDPAAATAALIQRLGAGALQRDLTVASASAGGYLVGTDNQGFIELLRNRAACFRLGARRLSGLVGSVTIPKHTASATAVWLANEASTATESTQTLAQVALTPKTVGAYTEISRQLTLQSSPSAESMVMADLAAVVAIAVDLAGLEGSGSGGQPTGISNTGSIGSFTGTSLAAAGVLDAQADVAAANIMPVRPGYVTTPAVAALLMARPELPSTGTTRLWQGNLWDGSIFSLPAMSTQQLTAATMIFGDWDKLVIGEWGVLEVEVNPYANFQAGIIGIRAMYSVDVAVRYAGAFSRATSIT